jgi:diguanylate cyclase (GGDEF)-like protein/PAS domain S-box-containing protein
MAAQAASMALSWQGKLEFEYTADLSLDAMLKRVASLPPSSIIIFTQYNRGANGQVTVAYEVEGMITKVANAPVFGLYDFNLANGGMGGSVVSVNGLGQKTGKVALDILSGQRALTQPITRLDVKAIPMFDWGQVQRWGGVASRLPDNAIFVNRVPTFWEQYKLYVLGFALFIVAQSFLIAALWVNKRRKEQAQAELARERDTAQLYLDIAGVMLMALDSQGRIMMINRKGAQILGEPENALLGKDWFENFIPEHQRSHVREVFNSIMSGDVLLLTQYENSIMDASGRERMMAWSNTLLRDASGAAIGTLSSADDITERKKSEERIQDLAFFDQLTGLPNRTLLQDRVKQTLAVSSRSGSYGALLFIDLDNFKTLNDTLGHDMGDQLLKLVAQRLKMGVREGDTVTRFGGDEFVVVLSELGSSEGDAAAAVEVVTDKILASLNQPYQLGNMPHHNTASIGIALFHGDLKSVDDLMKQADLAMYKAKAAGRNVARFFDPHPGVCIERASRHGGGSTTGA